MGGYEYRGFIIYKSSEKNCLTDKYEDVWMVSEHSPDKRAYSGTFGDLHGYFETNNPTKLICRKFWTLRSVKNLLDTLLD